MCTGMEILAAVGAIGGAAATLFAPQPDVPEPAAQKVPASPAEAARESGATVRVGVRDEVNGDDVTTNDDEFVPQRKQAQTITGLGRGGLAL